MNITISMRATVYGNTQKFINLTTFRKNGQAVSTPVTYAPYDGRLYVVTGARSGKVRRLKNNSRVEFAPCDSRGRVLGPAMQGQVRILTDVEAARLKPCLKFKAGNVLMFFFNRLRDLRQGGNIYLEVTPGDLK